MLTTNKPSRAARTTDLQAEHHADGEDRPFLTDTEKQQGVDNDQQDAASATFITSSRWIWLHIGLIFVYTTIFSAATFKSFQRPQECSTTSRLWSTSCKSCPLPARSSDIKNSFGFSFSLANLRQRPHIKLYSTKPAQ